MKEDEKNLEKFEKRLRNLKNEYGSSFSLIATA